MSEGHVIVWLCTGLAMSQRCHSIISFNTLKLSVYSHSLFSFIQLYKFFCGLQSFSEYNKKSVVIHALHYHHLSTIQCHHNWTIVLIYTLLTMYVMFLVSKSAGMEGFVLSLISRTVDGHYGSVINHMWFYQKSIH